MLGRNFLAVLFVSHKQIKPSNSPKSFIKRFIFKFGARQNKNLSKYEQMGKVIKQYLARCIIN